MFTRLATQWRVGPAGLIGLDYTSAIALFPVYGVEDHAEMIDALQVMELAALKVWNKGAR